MQILNVKIHKILKNSHNNNEKLLLWLFNLKLFTLKLFTL